MEPILPELDYLACEPVQHAILQRSHISVQPVVDTYKTGGDLKFEIKKSEHATALHESYLRLRCKIVKADGTACDHAATTTPDDVSVINNVLHSMWKQVTVSLNGHEVEKIDDYPYRAYVTMLTSYSSEVLQKRGALHGWIKDTAGNFGEFGLGATAKNKGLEARTAPFKTSKEVELIGRIESDVMNQGRNIPPETHIEICLSRTNNSFLLMSSAETGAYKLVITFAELEVARDKLAPGLLKAQQEISRKFNLSMDYRHCKVLTYTVPMGTNAHKIDAFTSSCLPDRFVAFFVSNKAYSGLYAGNPFEFKHYGLKHFSATHQEQMNTVPHSGYKPDFAKKAITYEYYSLLREFDADEENFMLDLSREEFAGGYTIYPFRFVHRTRGGDVLGPPASGTISLDIQFTDSLTEAVTLILVADYRGSFEIRSTGDFVPPTA
jgi:hypothetical protein